MALSGGQRIGKGPALPGEEVSASETDALDPFILTYLGMACAWGAIPVALRRTTFKHFHLGTQAMAADHWDEALEHFDLFLDQLRSRRPNRSILFLGGFQQDPKAMTLINMGVCELRRARPQVAEVYFQQASITQPDYALAHFNLGISHLAANQQLKAAHCFREAERRGYRRRRLNKGFGVIASAARNVLGLSDRSAAYTSLGSVYSQCGLHEEAIRCFRRAKANSEPGASAGLGCCLLQLGRLEEAAREARWCEAREANWTNTQLFLLAYYSMKGDFERALQHCALAGQLGGDPGWAIANTAETLMVAGRWDEADATAREALRAQSESPTAHGVLAQLAVRSQQWSTALQHADLGLESAQTGHLLEARAFALQGLGRRDEAIEAFATFLDYVDLLKPLECDLEYRTTLARQMVEELRRGGAQ